MNETIKKNLLFATYLLVIKGVSVKNIMVTLIAVSYTHLDVYKRQRYDSVAPNKLFHI